MAKRKRSRRLYVTSEELTGRWKTHAGGDDMVVRKEAQPITWEAHWSAYSLFIPSD